MGVSTAKEGMLPDKEGKGAGEGDNELSPTEGEDGIGDPNCRRDEVMLPLIVSATSSATALLPRPASLPASKGMKPTSHCVQRAPVYPSPHVHLHWRGLTVETATAAGPPPQSIKVHSPHLGGTPTTPTAHVVHPLVSL